MIRHSGLTVLCWVPSCPMTLMIATGSTLQGSMRRRPNLHARGDKRDRPAARLFSRSVQAQLQAYVQVQAHCINTFQVRKRGSDAPCVCVCDSFLPLRLSALRLGRCRSAHTAAPISCCDQDVVWYGGLYCRPVCRIPKRQLSRLPMRHGMSSLSNCASFSRERETLWYRQLV